MHVSSRGFAVFALPCLYMLQETKRGSTQGHLLGFCWQEQGLAPGLCLWTSQASEETWEAGFASLRCAGGADQLHVQLCFVSSVPT